MEALIATRRLHALAQESRLGVFRLLVRAGPEGVAAGDIARELGVAPNTLSAHLSVLANAGLIASRRESRSIIYAANYSGMSELLAFLVEDCCQGRAEVCLPVGAAISRAACCEQPQGDLQ
jgi:ArsR family transcriptional regulator, arsenate/arsenite/antimonite-responsive transcriptional repressor